MKISLGCGWKVSWRLASSGTEERFQDGAQNAPPASGMRKGSGLWERVHEPYKMRGGSVIENHITPFKNK